MCTGICDLLKTKSKLFLLLLILSGSFIGCRKDMTNERLTSYYGRSYTEIFEAFWSGMNTNYVFLGY